VIVKQNRSIAWYCVVKTSKKVPSIQILSAKIGDKVLPPEVVNCMKLLLVRACKLHKYFQFVFQVQDAASINEWQNNARMSLLGSTTEELHQDVIGKYFEQLAQCLQDKHTLLPPTQWIDQLALHDGENHLTLQLQLSDQYYDLVLYIWKVSCDIKLVISDVDGTVTTREYGSSSFLPGVKEMYNEIAKNRSLLFTYLTARPFKRTERIRELLYNSQGGKTFPRGPILTVPYETIDSIEGFSRGIATQVKAIHVVELQIQGVKCFAGFGNRKNDLKVYDKANIPKLRQVLNVWGNYSLIQGTHLSFEEVPQVLNDELLAEKLIQRKNWKCKVLTQVFNISNAVDRSVGKSYATLMSALYHIVTRCRRIRNTRIPQ